MKRLASLDRLPVIAMIGLLAVSWLGAGSYLAQAVSGEATPFTQVWAAYDHRGAAILVSWAVSGLLLAAVAPLGRSVYVTEVAMNAAITVQRLMPLWFLVALGGLMLLLYVKGPYLFQAPEYLMFAAARPLVSLANVLAPVTVLAIGVVSTRRPLLSTVLLAAVLIVLFSYATRLLAGVLLLYAVGRLLGGATLRWHAWVAALVFALLTLPVPLLNRNQSSHGLLTYMNATWEALTREQYFSHISAAVAENIGFTVPLLQFVAEKARIPWHSMVVSLNPAPGDLVGWDEVAPTLRVHFYIPYSMLGEFAAFGGLALFTAMFVWGLVVRWCIQRLYQVENPLMPVFLAAGVGLSLITVVYATQYNTRSVVRILTIMVALVAIEIAVRKFLLLRRELAKVPPLPVGHKPPFTGEHG
ncbi:hypothetical protein [Kocuria flava]|uniref:hypothetical protein n=1 Tax=Kocuria flava TaxID=446860 RepID=UPI00117DA07A|nr:hypothetical protein [Kocuria flava]